MRCMLFVPGDSERKLSKAKDLSVDALIVDLEDAVSGDARPAARKLTSEFLKDVDNAWVRINPISGSDAQDDLDAVMPSAPAGIVLPKPDSPDDVKRLSERLDALEAQHGIDAKSTRIVSLCTERVGALFSLSDYRHVGERLLGLSWGAEDLSAEVGARTNRDAEGQWLPPYEMARTLCLFAARAAGVLALDTVFTNFRDEPGLANYAANAARDGFDGMLAIHPAQVDVIQEAFTPSGEELERASRIVEAFDSAPTSGVVSLDGVMLDKPHLLQAQRILSKRPS